MDNTNYNKEEDKILLEDLAIEHLNVSAKWSMFLAIMGFIGIAFMVLAGIFMGLFMSKNLPGMGWMMSGMYLIIAFLYSFPVYYLYKYASDVKFALLNKNSIQLTAALGFLKLHHKYIGIAIIAIIALYIIFFSVFMILLGGNLIK